ncbi:Vesicle transport protein [Actinidia chinensis var. chinensis]|uniref:Vesicle transport protein n=1 Tax=Actinidia chinensis var. chinensis TaxID=1590841 RepID=A0A2R6QSB4_ACTCC|nr:Vesicle transport protein [Actinidia chinensis var. chinensis]
MEISKTEINLRRLLAAAPQQQNQAKLIHYIATLREQLEGLTEEKTPDGLPRVSKVQLNDYSEKIEAIASKLAVPVSTTHEPQMPFAVPSVKESPSKTGGESLNITSPKLRRRIVPQSNIEDRPHNTVETDNSAPVKLDAAAQTHIEKHRKLQEDLTDEMVGLARQLKERSLVMSQSVKNTEKILDSTEQAVEHSLASTGRVNTRAMDIYSKSFKTTCFTWLVIFFMTCIFVMVVLLIRVT